MATVLAGRILAWLAYVPRKRVTACLLALIASVFTIAILGTVNTRLQREDRIEQEIVHMKDRMSFMQSMYFSKVEEVVKLQGVITQEDESKPKDLGTAAPLSAAANDLLKNLSGSMVARGMNTKNVMPRSPFVFQLLPHLIQDPNSLKPAFHMHGNVNYADIVIGVPTVKRDKESYLLITLGHLIEGLRDEDLKTTLIVVYVGETDLEFVMNTARQIEALFPEHVKSGLIEVISPAASYYPDLDSMAPTLGDSFKRFRWRTKQNLDTMYLMAYARTKGVYYLMVEDDTICKKSYMKEIKQYTAEISVSNPKWFFIEYCPIGGIGKLFRSTDLLHFITYVQLFYDNLPIDWLLESYLADRVCTIEKNSKTCKLSKMEIRPKYASSLFQHIGLYSSLKGKIQKVKDPHFGVAPTFYPHKNPPLSDLKIDIAEHSDHTIQRAYNGHTFFWGVKPKANDVIEFWFTEPIALERYTFRSGNVEHVSDKFLNTAVEILSPGKTNFTEIGIFDEFGLAEKQLDKDVGLVTAIRLKVKQNLTYWAILSEIELKPVSETS